MSDELLKKILNKLDGLEGELRDTRAQMNSRFDTLDTKLSRVEGDVSNIKTTVDLMASETPEGVFL